MSDAPPMHTSDVDEGEESTGEEKLGRGARSKAKVCRAFPQ